MSVVVNDRSPQTNDENLDVLLQHATSPTESHSQSTSELTSASSPRVWSLGQHCPELDGVRGIAIAMVTLYRFGKELQPEHQAAYDIARSIGGFGSRGVDLFFVLSGFLITGILLHTKSSPGYFTNFIARRALRIFPLYFAALFVCLYVVPALLTAPAFELAKVDQFYLWAYCSNVRMAWTNAWCFGPLDHFWSLAVEEHFYLIWPAVIYFLSPKSLLRLTVATVLAVGLIRILASLRPEWTVAVDVLTVFRCDALCLGAMLAVLMQRGLKIERVRHIAMIGLPILVATAVVMVLSGKRWLTLPHSVFPVMWTILMAIVVTRTTNSPLSRILRLRGLQWLGKYSYGMYVVQLPLVTLLPLSLLASWLGARSTDGPWFGVLYIALLFAITCGLALLSYHALEKPFLKLKRFFGPMDAACPTTRVQ